MATSTGKAARRGITREKMAAARAAVDAARAAAVAAVRAKQREIFIGYLN